MWWSLILSASLVCLILVETASTGPMREEGKAFKVPYKYPHFRQCDSKWSNDTIVNKTICQVGCLLSSISMALNYYMITIDGQPVDPGTLNKWLQVNNGYTDGNNLVEEALEKLSSRIIYNGRKEYLSIIEIVDYLDKGTVTIAHVRNGTHFVLVTGYTPIPSQYWLVNDPAFNQTVYTTQEIVNYRIFSIKPDLL